MASSALLVLLLVSVSKACMDSHWKGLLWNKFVNSADPGYIEGTVDTATAGESVLVSISNGNQYTIVDQGVVFDGDVTAAVPPRPASAFITDTMYYAAVWSDTVAGTTMDMEYKILLRDDEFDDAGILIGPNICYFETVEDRLVPYAGSVTVEEMLIVTWRHDDTTNEILSQLVLAFTSTASYVLMNFESTPALNAIDGSAVIAHWNSDYANAASPSFATVCSATKATDLTTMSNDYCGHAGEIVFDLGDPCTDAAICGNLAPDLEDRNNNCRELLKPADNCYVRGTCTWVGAETFQFNFIFLKTVAKFDNFEIVDTNGDLLDSDCTLSASDDGDFYTIDVPVDLGYASTCGITDNTGVFGFRIHNYDDTNMIYKQKSKIFEIMCDPGDLVTGLTQKVTVGDVEVTSFSPGTGDMLQLEWGNMADTSDVDYYAFQDGDNAIVGTLLYPVVTFLPGSSFERNAYPYGVYVTSCMIGNTDAFDDQTYVVVTNRCPVTGLPAFEFATGFKVFNPATITYGSTHTIVAGPMRAARWTTGESIWLQCVVDFCTTTGFDDSYCINSCDGTGVNDDGSRRKRRETSDTSVVLTAHLKVIDRVDAESSLSCANETLAYTTIGALLTLLLIATAITALLFLKMRSRKRK